MKTDQNLTFRQPNTIKAFYFLPLLSFIPAYIPLMVERSQINFVIFFLSFFIIATLAYNAAAKATIKINSIQIIIYQSRKGHTINIYLDDIDYVTIKKNTVLIWGKLTNKPLECRLREKDTASLATFFNSKHIKNELLVDQPSPYDWKLLLS